MRTLAGGTEGYRDGVGRQAQFFHPTGLTFDHKRKIVYVTDQVGKILTLFRLSSQKSLSSRISKKMRQISDRQRKMYQTLVNQSEGTEK